MAETLSISPAENIIQTISVNDNLLSSEERQIALEHARAASIPSKEEEDWRKTDPNQFPWSAVENAGSVATEISATSGDDVSFFDARAIRDILRDMFRVPGDDFDAKFLYYQRAFASNPVCVHIPAGVTGISLQAIHNLRGSGTFSPLTIIVVEKNAELTLADHWQADSPDTAIIGRTEIIIRDGGKLNYIHDEQVHPTSAIYRFARVQIERDAEINWTFFSEGAKWHVARLTAQLNGSGSTANLSGLFAASGDNRADHRTHQYHGAPHAKSNLLFKTILAGRARSIYQGLISVPRQSQKTDAYQQCRNLMLDAGTHADAIPKLEIIADDVRCTHGASIGSLNKEQLFYLQSRGLDRRQAMTAIAAGFGEQIIDQSPSESVRESWRQRVTKIIGLAGALS